MGRHNLRVLVQQKLTAHTGTALTTIRLAADERRGVVQLPALCMSLVSLDNINEQGHRLTSTSSVLGPLIFLLFFFL
jgi:hypothetical protein